MKGTILQTALPIISQEEIIAKQDSTKAVIQDIANGLANNPSETLHALLQEFVHFGIKVVAALVLYFIGACIIKRIKRLLASVFVRRNTDKALATFVSSFVSIMLTVILIVITISTLGINTTSLAALLAAGGMAIGMALSGTVQNFAGGILIIVFKPFKAGDFIETQGFSGTVTEVTICNTILATTDNRVVILPNSSISSGTVNNYSRNPLRRVEWTVNVEYGSDAEACGNKLLELIRADGRVIDASVPGAADPFVALSALGESALVFIVRAWVRSENYWGVYFDFNKTVYTELPKAGFSFPYPQINVHLDRESS